jgi:hypothetical protein
MDVQRASAAGVREPATGFGGTTMTTTTQDENAHVMMHRSGKDGGAGGGGARGSTLKKGLGGKTFATTTTKATTTTMTGQHQRSALGNITNKGLSARGGASVVAPTPTKPPGSVKEPRVKAKAPAPASALRADDDAGLERVRATIAPEELANIRARAEMYADESDDIEYFGKTHEEQAKEERARERAAVEERVRGFLANAAAAASYDANFGTTTSLDDKNESLRASIKNLSLKASFTSGGDGGGGFNADGEDDVMDDLCNFMSPTKMPGMLDDDDDVDEVLFGGRAGVDDLAYLDEELDAMLAD